MLGSADSALAAPGAPWLCSGAPAPPGTPLEPGLGLAGLAVAPGVTATVRRPGVTRRGSLGLQSEEGRPPPTFTVSEVGVFPPAGTARGRAEQGDFSGGGSPGDFRLGDFSLGSLARSSAELGCPDFVGDTIFNLESSGLACLSGLTVWPDGSVRGSLGEIC